MNGATATAPGQDTSTLRILEIGDQYYFKAQYPERTTLLWTGWRILPAPELFDAMATPGRVIGALRAAARGRYDVIVVYPLRYAALHPRFWMRGPIQTPLDPWAGLTRAAGVAWLRLYRPDIPLVAIDMDDASNLAKPAVFLLDTADLFLKRELPVDRWRLLSGTIHQQMATLRFRKNTLWRDRISKIEPVSLPQWMVDPALTHGPFPDKSFDVFYAGTTRANSTVRETGLPELERLRAQGFRIDIADGPLPFADYSRRMARAWLAWSPEGRGWDCNRHYEAPLVQTVPVMNYPTILRHAPLRDGVHCFLYEPHPGELERTVHAALSDRARLKQMALAARDHAAANHTRKAYCDRILALALASRAGAATGQAGVAVAK